MVVSLTNIQHNENFLREKDLKKLVITKKYNFQHIKRRTLTVKYQYFFIGTKKWVIQVWKIQKIIDFEKIRTFLILVIYKKYEQYFIDNVLNYYLVYQFTVLTIITG